MQICKNNYQIKSKQNASLCIVMFLLGGIVSVASEGADKIHLFFFLCMMVKCSLITLLPGVESCLTKARTRVLFNQVNPTIRQCQQCPKSLHELWQDRNRITKIQFTWFKMWKNPPEQSTFFTKIFSLMPYPCSQFCADVKFDINLICYQQIWYQTWG